MKQESRGGWRSEHEMDNMGQPGWEGSLRGRMDTYICMAESLHCSPETITTLFVNWLYSNTKQKVSF